MRTIDRCQLMILECAHELKAQLGAFWDNNRANAGIFVGHMGVTRSAMLYTARCYLDEIESILRASARLAESPWLPKVLEGLRREVRRLAPPSFSRTGPRRVNLRTHEPTNPRTYEPHEPTHLRAHEPRPIPS